VKEESVREDESETLNTLKNDALDNRPHKDSLSWPTQKKGGNK